MLTLIVAEYVQDAGRLHLYRRSVYYHCVRKLYSLLCNDAQVATDDLPHLAIGAPEEPQAAATMATREMVRSALRYKITNLGGMHCHL